MPHPPPATDEALVAAFDLIGDEIARREVFASRADDETTSARLMAGLWALNFTTGVLNEDILPNDFLRYAEDLREDLADLPAPDPDIDDAWILKSE